VTWATSLPTTISPKANMAMRPVCSTGRNTHHAKLTDAVNRKDKSLIRTRSAPRRPLVCSSGPSRSYLRVHANFPASLDHSRKPFWQDSTHGKGWREREIPVLSLPKTPSQWNSVHSSEVPAIIGTPGLAETCTTGANRESGIGCQGTPRHINPQSETVRQGSENGRLGRASLVTMMKPTHFWNLDDSTLIRRLHFSGIR
jgi:hypothetical protein